MHIILTCKYEKYRMKNRREKVATPFFPFITLWELSVAMETRNLIGSGLKLNVWSYKAFIEPEKGALILETEWRLINHSLILLRHGGLVVECQTSERKVRCLILTQVAVLYP